MKTRVVLTIAFMGFVLFAFSQKEYKMWETIYIKPDMSQIDELKKGMAEHNKKFHNEDPFKAHIWQVWSGPNENTWLWTMGPCTWTDLDSRPEGKDHDDHWAEHITPYVKKVYGLQYWKLHEDLSHMPEDAPRGKVVWTAFDIKPFEGYRFKEMLKKVNKVYTEKNYPNSMGVYEAQLDNNDGMDYILEWEFDKYAWFDRDNKFVKDFEEVHGEGSWMYFMEEFRDVVEGVFDEMADFVPELSGGE
jgi:hypothetical protein